MVSATVVRWTRLYAVYSHVQLLSRAWPPSWDEQRQLRQQREKKNGHRVVRTGCEPRVLEIFWSSVSSRTIHFNVIIPIHKTLLSLVQCCQTRPSVVYVLFIPFRRPYICCVSAGVCHNFVDGRNITNPGPKHSKSPVFCYSGGESG